MAPFLWEKYYTRKEVTCEYNILVDILYVWKDEDSWTQVESDIQILALPVKKCVDIYIFYLGVCGNDADMVLKKYSREHSAVSFFLIVPKNYTTLKQELSVIISQICFTTIENYTTLKHHDLSYICS